MKSVLNFGLIFLLTPLSFLSVYANASVEIIPPASNASNIAEDESILFLNITYWNKTQATVNGTVLNFEASDEIVQFIQNKIAEEKGLDLEGPEEIQEEEVKEEDNDNSPEEPSENQDPDLGELPPGIDPIPQFPEPGDEQPDQPPDNEDGGFETES